jgi:hypothetical protein
MIPESTQKVKLLRYRDTSDHSSESADSNPLGLRAGSSVSHRRRLVRE